MPDTTIKLDNAAPQVGQEAPDFSARDTDGQTVTLSEFRGSKNVLLVFYPFAFTRTCTSEFCQLRDENADLASSDDLEVFGISCDTVAALRIWKNTEEYPNRFLSDFWPHGEIARKYGAFDERLGSAVRSTFLIDKQGIIRFAEQGTLEQLATARDQGTWKEALAKLA